MGNPTGQGPIPFSCERCGRRVELQPSSPGDRDLGLDRIKAAFRYCATCQLFVGRTCCWQPEAVACTVDAPRFALTTVRPQGQPLNPGASDATARRGLDEMAASLEALERVVVPVRHPPASDAEREIGTQAWVAAWGQIGWLVASIETSRDAAAKALWRPPIGADASPSQELTTELKGLERRYPLARAAAVARLRAAGEPLERHRRWTKRALQRMAASPLALAALAVVVVLSFSTASLLQLGLIDPFAAGRSAAASQPEEAVLGGTPSGLIAGLAFDSLAIGALDASGGIASVTRDVRVIDVAPPFDRGISIRGIGSRHVCVPSTGSEDGSIRFDLDLWTQSALASGRLKLTVAPAEAVATVVVVPLRVLGTLPRGTWHRLHAAWAPRQPAAVAIGEASGQLRELTVPLARNAEATPGTVCVAVSGLGRDEELLIGTLRVRR